MVSLVSVTYSSIYIIFTVKQQDPELDNAKCVQIIMTQRTLLDQLIQFHLDFFTLRFSSLLSEAWSSSGFTDECSLEASHLLFAVDGVK